MPVVLGPTTFGRHPLDLERRPAGCGRARRVWSTLVLALLGGASGACLRSGERAPAETDPPGAPAILDGAAAEAGPSQPIEPPRCRPGPGASGAPGSLIEAVALINSLPRPVTLPCFLQSLERPLAVTATDSFISLQPAVGSRSPRIILFSKDLVITVVPEGRGAHTVEFGQFVAENRTLKAELSFPIANEVHPEDAFAKILHTSGTVCRFCHAQEVSAAALGFPGGFVSSALRPHEPTLVDLEELRAHHTTCNPVLEPQRCAILSALFDHGPVLLRDFPPTVPSLFD